MANEPLLQMLLRFDAASKAMHDGAQQWLAGAKTQREQEFAKTLLRHVRGVQVALAAGRWEVERAQAQD